MEYGYLPGFNDAKNEDVFEFDPNLDRDEEELDEPALPLAPTFIDAEDEVDGVLLPDEPISKCQN